MHSIIALAVVIWFIAATVAALAIGAILGAVSPPAPLPPLPDLVHRPHAEPERDAMAACASRR
jgi:hypothetical protein